MISFTKPRLKKNLYIKCYFLVSPPQVKFMLSHSGMKSMGELKKFDPGLRTRSETSFPRGNVQHPS